jgi:hypothetical protein
MVYLLNTPITKTSRQVAIWNPKWVANVLRKAKNSAKIQKYSEILPK